MSSRRSKASERSRIADQWQPIVIGDPVVVFEPTWSASQHFRPDSVADGWSTEHFTVRGASVRGYLHRYHGTAREDDFAVAVHQNSGTIVIAVADGVSGAELAHLGATLVCRSAVDFLLRTLEESQDEVDWLELVRCASWSLVEFAARHLALADPDPKLTERLLATTLVVALVRPLPAGSATASVVQVGDSGAWVLQHDGWRHLFSRKIDPAEVVFSSEVSALPRVPESISVVQTELPPDAVLLLGTDGFADPLGDGDGQVGQLFAGQLREPPPPLGFAHLLDFSRETFDDDRALVAVWRRPGNRDGLP